MKNNSHISNPSIINFFLAVFGELRIKIKTNAQTIDTSIIAMNIIIPVTSNIKTDTFISAINIILPLFL